MKYFGINHIGHDAGVVVFDEYGNLEFYAEAERYGDRIKNCMSIRPLIEFMPKPKKEDIVCVVFHQRDKMKPCHQYDKNYIRQSNEDLKFANLRTHVDFVVDHHLCHCLSSWCFRPNDEERLFLSYDGFGSDGNGELKSYLVGTISEDNFSIIENSFPIFSSACISNLLGENTAGKLMGLSGYNFSSKNINWNNENLAILIDSIYYLFGIKKTRWKENIDFVKDKNIIDYMSAFYKIVTNQIWLDLEKNIDNFLANKKGVVLGGGSALALEINSLIYNKVQDVVFGPPINDSGLALGAGAFAYWHVNKKWPIIKTPSLNFLQQELPKVGTQSPKEIAKIISSNNFVGLLRNKAESGPRSLGFRSILASANRLENLYLVSQQLKGREFYRPLAPMVTEESFSRYFIGPKGKYMQYKVECTEECQKELPAIVHSDNSARPQVVQANDDPWLHDLLTNYEKISGHACLINTSLNGKGKPICNTFEDAKIDFANKDIELISVS
jgi:carbamoyltransferase